MMELSEELRKVVHGPTREPVRLVDPVTRETFVLVRADDYERLRQGEYDDSPWTEEERDLLAAEVDAMLEDDMAIEDQE